MSRAIGSGATVLLALLLSACVPLEGKSTHETLGPDYTHLQSTIWNTDGTYTDAWQKHSISEIPPGLTLRICGYQAERIWMAMDHVTFPYIPSAEYSPFHSGCSAAAYFDLPDRVMTEGLKVRALWSSNHTNNRFWAIGTHEFGIN